MSDALNADLNTTIAAAVNARIEAQVAEAMAGDQIYAELVRSALRQPVEIPNRDGSYGKERVPFMLAMISEAIREATKAAVKRYFEEHAAELELEVAKQLRRNSKDIASTLIESLTNAANKTYGVNVAMTVRMPVGD